MSKRESLRIGLFSWESIYSIRVGGIAPHVTELAETFATLGHEVHIFTRIGEKNEYDEINGVHYQRCRYNQSGGIVTQMDNMCDAFLKRFDSVKKHFGTFDVIHGHDWHPVIALNNIKNVYNLNYILTYHSTEWGRNGNNFGERWEFGEISHREWLGGYESAEVIVTSVPLKSEIQFLYSIPDYKINLIPNAIFTGKIKRDIDPGKIKRQYNIHPLAPVVLFVGRMNYQKGPDLLIEAIPKVLKNRWDVKFVFIGEGEMLHYCKHRAWQLGVWDVCRFLGYTSEEVKTQWINACDVVCVPSRNEPFCIVVLEAWDASKPVVGTEAVHLISNFSTGIHAYNSPDSIAWCISYTMDNPEKAQGMGKNGNTLIAEKYNWNKIADMTLRVYKGIL